MKLIATLLFIGTALLGNAQCIGDCQDDFGIVKESDSEFYKGFFADGKRHGAGYEGNGSNYYYGTYSVGNRHGMGVYSDGTGYGFGEFANGKKTGKHIVTLQDGKINVIAYSEGVATSTTSYTPTYDLQQPGCVFGDCSNGFGSYFYFPNKVPTIVEGFFAEGKLAPFSIFKRVNLNTNDVTYKNLNYTLDGKTYMIDTNQDFTMISQVEASTEIQKGHVLIFYMDGYSKIIEVDGDQLVRAIFEGTEENLIKN